MFVSFTVKVPSASSYTFIENLAVYEYPRLSYRLRVKVLPASEVIFVSVLSAIPVRCAWVVASGFEVWFSGLLM